MQSRKGRIGSDKLFTLEDSQAQISLTASNSKYVSVEGEEMRASRTLVTDNEIFQLEALDRTDQSGNVKFAILCKTKKYWSWSGAGCGIVADKDNASDANTHFTIEWLGRYIVIKASNGRYLAVKGNGAIVANSHEAGDENQFVFQLTNGRCWL